MWIGTNGDGLIRLKDRAVRMFTTVDGLPNNVIMTVLASREGSLWTGANCGGPSRFDGRGFRTYSEKDGLLNSCVYALAEDAGHDLWIATYGGGAFRFRDGRFTQYSKAQGLASDTVTSIVAARDGSLWLTMLGAVSRVRNGQIRNYTTADGLSGNRAKNVYEDRSGAIFVATGKGIDRLAGDRFVNVSSVGNSLIGGDQSGGIYVFRSHSGIFRIEKNLPIRVVPDIWASNTLETKQGDVWLSGAAIYRFPTSGLQGLRGRDEPLDYATFGRADGLGAMECSYGFPNSALTRDGKLWVATPHGLAMLDLPHLPRTNQKPSIYVEEVTVGRNVEPPGYELALPPGTHHVELHFDAIEISSPEKIHLQYRLDSVDSEWLHAGPLAHAIYSNIPHGTHAFHMRACNRDGIWDRAGTVYSIVQQPYFYEMTSFRLAAAIAAFLLLAGLHVLRLRRATAGLNARLGERMAERERIARELHDTLLQSLQGLILRFQAAARHIDASEPARQLMESALDRADEVMVEGRDRVKGLRTKDDTDGDLSQSFSQAILELAGEKPAQFRVIVQGTPRPLHPLVRDEIYRIGREALINAFCHANGHETETEISYSRTELRLRFRDDGPGIDPEILASGSRPEHWGLAGMRERARKIGASLDIWSRPGAGTEVDLRIPASVAYQRGVAGRLRHLLRSASRKEAVE